MKRIRTFLRPFLQMPRLLQATAQATSLILQKVDRMSKEQDDLNAAVAALTGAVGPALTLIQAEVQKIMDQAKQAPGVDPAAVEASAATINGMADQINAAVTAANTALSPPSA